MAEPTSKALPLLLVVHGCITLAAGAVLVYIVLVVSLTLLVGLVVLYPVGIIIGKMPASAFASFCAPAQAVAFASRSSLAALPAMVESAERAKLPPVISRFIMPLAASVFRVGGAVAMPVGVLFLARLYGATLSPSHLASIAFTVILTTFAVPGVPGGSIIAKVPVRVLAAGGASKVQALYGALKLIKPTVLITDEYTARDVLELADGA